MTIRSKIFLLISLACLSTITCAWAQDSGLLVTVLQEPQALSSPEEIDKLVDFSRQAGIRNIFIQVYRGNRSWFASELADQTPYLQCLESCHTDPLQLLIYRAHQSGLKVYAWLNMLSLGENKNAPILDRHGTGILTADRRPKNKLIDYKIDGQYFLEPSDQRVRKELLDILDELLNAYSSLDGVLFDYIRYPDVHPDYGYSPENISRFREKTGLGQPHARMPAWQDWKRRQVSGLLADLGGRVRQIRPSMQVAATGCADYSRAFNEAFQDWPAWLDTKTVDFVTFMSYESDPRDYRLSIATAKEHAPDFSRVMLTVGAYKQLKTPKQFGRLLQICREQDSGGCIVFHYGNIIDSPELAAEAKR